MASNISTKVIQTFALQCAPIEPAITAVSILSNTKLKAYIRKELLLIFALYFHSLLPFPSKQLEGEE